MEFNYEAEIIDLETPFDPPEVLHVVASSNSEARKKARKEMRKNFPRAKEGRDYKISSVHLV